LLALLKRSFSFLINSTPYALTINTNNFNWWKWGESNPCPETSQQWRLHA